MGATKIRDTAPQKELSEGDGEDTAVARVANSVMVKNVPARASVLIMDDMLRSGGTMIETARALRAAGAEEAFGLNVAKDAKFRSGVDFSKEWWP